MIKKNHEVKLRQRTLFIILFLLSVFFSFINLFSFLDFDFYSEYFIALLVLTISSNLIEVSINKIFLIGILVDILIGSILGQYTLTFLILLGLQIFSQKYFVLPTKPQSMLLRFLFVSLGVIIVSIISQKFSPNFYSSMSLLNQLIIDIGVTFFILIIFQIFYEKTYGS